jgi:hypothetical protein
MRATTANQVESDLAALKAAAERAGTALACLFSSSDEFEAAVIRTRRAQGVLPLAQSRSRWSLARLVGISALAVAFLVI